MALGRSTTATKPVLKGQHQIPIAHSEGRDMPGSRALQVYVTIFAWVLREINGRLVYKQVMDSLILGSKTTFTA